MPNVVHEHREAAKELSKLPKAVRQRFDVVKANIEQDSLGRQL
jgi:mRNA-degrading endonuclease RelE of RelBE toxin-antitoxin system